VQQILANLLSNAVKFTNPGGRVTVRCSTVSRAGGRGSPTQAWTTLQVDDTGVGIEPDRMAAVWEPFVQAQMGHTRAYGGTGLGLTISRRLARLMDGDLTAESTPGVGSTFTLWLPTAARLLPDDASPVRDLAASTYSAR
jgi:signal transduction histidine kinase